MNSRIKIVAVPSVNILLQQCKKMITFSLDELISLFPIVFSKRMGCFPPNIPYIAVIFNSAGMYVEIESACGHKTG